MENKEIKAKISNKFSPRGLTITLCLFYIIPIILLIIGLAIGYHQHLYYNWGSYYSWESYDWFGITLYYISEYDKTFIEWGNIFGVITIVVILPLCLFAIYLLLGHRKRKLTELSVSNSELVGSYTAFIPIAKITLKMPIEKIDNIAAVKNVFFLYTGKALRIGSASSVIKIPYVINADEIVEFILAAIEKAKNRPIKSTVEQKNPQTDAMDSLKKLAELRDSGIINEEEFNQKKSDLLSKM